MSEECTKITRLLSSSASRVHDRTVWKALNPCRNINAMTSIPERILLTHTRAETCVNLVINDHTFKDILKRLFILRMNAVN